MTGSRPTSSRPSGETGLDASVGGSARCGSIGTGLGGGGLAGSITGGIGVTGGVGGAGALKVGAGPELLSSVPVEVPPMPGSLVSPGRGVDITGGSIRGLLGGCSGGAPFVGAVSSGVTGGAVTRGRPARNCTASGS